MARDEAADELESLRGYTAVRVVTETVGIRRLKALVDASV
jgi:hypothetical protein